MAYAKHIGDLVVQQGNEFDEARGPGTAAPLSGVYLCEGCRRSVVARRGEPLPAAAHHRHEDARQVMWRLLVRSHWA